MQPFVMPDWSRDDLTNGEILHPAMRVRTQEEASAFLDGYVTYQCRRWGGTQEHQLQTVKANIGYWTGYFDAETARRVMDLFECAHPIFGRRTDVSPQEALAAGQRVATGFPQQL